MSGSRILILTWRDGREEEVLCEDWSIRDEVMSIRVNLTTRETRFIALGMLREWRTKG